jgi:hypothetical protein
MKTFNESLNEGKISIGKMSFVVSSFVDSDGLALQFIAENYETLDIPEREQISQIMAKLKKSVPELAKMFRPDSSSAAAGIVFRLNKYEFTDYITKQMSR